MLLFSKWLDGLFGRTQGSRLIRRNVRRGTRPTLEVLESRIVPTVQLLYGGAGTALSLLETSVGNDSVTVSESAAGVLRIDLGTGTFAAGSSLIAGLTYENAGLPATSHFARVDIHAANAVSSAGSMAAVSR